MTDHPEDERTPAPEEIRVHHYPECNDGCDPATSTHLLIAADPDGIGDGAVHDEHLLPDEVVVSADPEAHVR